jgi:hypothetical protein
MIKTEVYTDDRRLETTFDATPWFVQASDEAIRALIDCDFGGDYASDEIAIWFGDNAEIAEIFTYLDIVNRAARESIGFEVNVDKDSVLEWLAANRPHLHLTG